MYIALGFLFGGYVVLILLTRKIHRRLSAIEEACTVAAEDLERDLYE